MASHLSLAQWANLFQRKTVIVPGLHGSNEHHWQSHWQSRFPHAVRAEVRDWSVASLSRWYHAIDKAAGQAQGDGRVLLVGHSFGALASAIYAVENPQTVGGLLLVAPASPDKFNLTSQLDALPGNLTALVVGSENDPWMPEPQAQELAGLLGADYQVAGALGHINVVSGVGAWWEGLGFLRQVADRAEQADGALWSGVLRESFATQSLAGSH